jgi:hypothetical protein
VVEPHAVADVDQLACEHRAPAMPTRQPAVIGVSALGRRQLVAARSGATLLGLAAQPAGVVVIIRQRRQLGPRRGCVRFVSAGFAGGGVLALKRPRLGSVSLNPRLDTMGQPERFAESPGFRGSVSLVSLVSLFFLPYMRE